MVETIPRLERPPGTSVRDFFTALKAQDGEMVQRAHRNWTTQRVQEAYGLPDEIKDRGSYIEWIYFLEDPTPDGSKRRQFDFHFTAGLCTVAH